MYTAWPHYNDQSVILFSSVGIALGYGLTDRGSVLPLQAGQEISVLSMVSSLALGSTLSPIMNAVDFSRGIKRPGCYVDRSPPFVAEVTNT
jgi:hypothetical protein